MRCNGELSYKYVFKLAGLGSTLHMNLISRALTSKVEYSSMKQKFNNLIDS